MIEFTYAKLRGRIIEKFGTIEAFAKAIGRSTVSVSRKLNGKAGFSQADMDLWAGALDFGPSEYGEYFFT